MSDVSDIFEICAYIAEFGHAMIEMKHHAAKFDVVPNVFFIENGLDIGPSPNTLANLRQRRIKAFVSIGVTALGTVQHAVTTGMGAAVNVAEIGKQAAAVASTAVHLARLGAMARKVRDGGSLARWLNYLMQVKSVKVARRTAQLGLACIPVPGVSLLGIPIAIAHHGYAHVYQRAVMIRTAMEIHWRAYRELKLLGVQGAIGGAKGSGPALAIVRELTGVGVDVIGSIHSAKVMNEIMFEPGGHQVILYKLQQS